MEPSIRLGDFLGAAVTILGLVAHWVASGRRMEYWRGQTTARIDTLEAEGERRDDRVTRVEGRVTELERGGPSLALRR